MKKRNAIVFCLAAGSYQFLSCSQSNITNLLNPQSDITNLLNPQIDITNNLLNSFEEFIQKNESRKLATFFANPHGQKDLQLISHIADNSINNSNYNNNIDWQNLAIICHVCRVPKNSTGVHLLPNQREQTLIQREQTLIRYFYKICQIKMLPSKPFSILLGKMNQNLQYITKKLLKVEITSYDNIIRTYTFEKPDQNYKLMIAPYNIEHNVFEETELTWENVEKHEKEGRYTNQDGNKYIIGLFKRNTSIFFRFKIYLPESVLYLLQTAVEDPHISIKTLNENT